MLKEIIIAKTEERKSLHEHMKRLSGVEVPANYLELGVPESFEKLYRISLADTLGLAIGSLVLLNALRGFVKEIGNLFR